MIAASGYHHGDAETRRTIKTRRSTARSKATAKSHHRGHRESPSPQRMLKAKWRRRSDEDLREKKKNFRISNTEKNESCELKRIFASGQNVATSFNHRSKSEISNSVGGSQLPHDRNGAASSDAICAGVQHFIDGGGRAD